MGRWALRPEARATGKEQRRAVRETAISYAAYRLLLWRASFGANLDWTFALLTRQLRSLCYSPDFTSTTGDSPAALGNRIAAAAIASGRHDGSLEALHYVDPSYVPVNAPLVVSAAGSTVHDATFWQPLALARRPRRAAAGPGGDPELRGHPVGPRPRRASRQGFRSTRAAASRRPVERRVQAGGGRGDPGDVAAGARTVGWTRRPSAGTASPTAPCRRTERGRAPRHDVRLYFALNGALNDAAVAAWGAKRAYQSPRPISMIRYLAFNNQLPLVPGLIKSVGGQQLVLRAGRWVPGERWSPLAPTPASPGWASGDSAFAYAAGEVLTALTGHSFAGQAARAATQGADRGTELPGDVTAGRTVGTKVGKLVRRKLAG